MSFIGFLYKGERPKSETERALEKDRERLAKQVATLETRMAALRAAPAAGLGSPAAELAEPAGEPGWASPRSTGAGPAASAAIASEDTVDETKAKGQLKIAILLAYAMTIFGSIDLIGIIVLLAIGREVPDSMQLFFSGILGYFGGALNAYMGVK